jgi:hypothetical protein
MRKDNKIVVDLNKVQWARFYYRNQYGQTKDRLPTYYSVRLAIVNDHERVLWHPDRPIESTFDAAKRLDILDIWQPEITLKLTANEYLIYTGAKAISINECWNAKVFGKGKKR